MDKDAAIRTSMIAVGAAIAAVGLATFSFKKMAVTYVFGALAVAGVLLPDWEYFDRDVREWFTPMPGDRTGPAPTHKLTGLERLKAYPLRTTLFIVVYSFGLYKWWSYVSS